MLSRKLTLGEEIGNSITHGAMAFIMLCILPFAAIYSYTQGSIIDVVGICIFCISAFCMFLASTLYHIMSYDTKHKQVLRIMDHIFIYVAIAGSYTPIALSVIKGWVGIVVVSIQWIMVLFGILYKSLADKKMPKASLAIYLTMGWVAILVFPILIKNANIILLSLILLGGIFYSTGALIYSKKFKFNHMVWHLFVNLGVISHFIAIVFFLY